MSVLPSPASLNLIGQCPSGRIPFKTSHRGCRGLSGFMTFVMRTNVPTICVADLMDVAGREACCTHLSVVELDSGRSIWSYRESMQQWPGEAAALSAATQSDYLRTRSRFRLSCGRYLSSLGVLPRADSLHEQFTRPGAGMCGAAPKVVACLPS